METIELINRFLEETGLDDDRRGELIIAYGSRVKKNNKFDSDLDIMIISNSNRSYSLARIIDGIKVECIIYSKEDFLDKIEDSLNGNSSFLLSVFKHSIIVKNNDNLFEHYLNLINEYKIDNSKKDIKIKTKEHLTLSYLKFRNHPTDFIYFNLLETIRATYHYVNNYSNISSMKVYDLYQNKEKSEEYSLTLPDDNFINLYFKAITAPANERMEILNTLFEVLEINPSHYSLNVKRDDYSFKSEDTIKKTVVILYNKMQKVINKLVYQTPDAMSCYYIVLNELIEFNNSFNDYNELVEELLESALNEFDSNKRIHLIEKIFYLVAKNYQFDYDDYYIKLELK